MCQLKSTDFNKSRVFFSYFLHIYLLYLKIPQSCQVLDTVRTDSVKAWKTHEELMYDVRLFGLEKNWPLYMGCNVMGPSF